MCRSGKRHREKKKDGEIDQFKKTVNRLLVIINIKKIIRLVI